ncbi:MAG: DUF1579 domain-containing protein [Novosphingobium sp.]|jgi:hypothetical protein|uniref:DUF1579 domain-containing protein n=1 Tax=Novosphingobium sp. TaxID=1874826 RepID=UPI003919FFC5|nr:DUF1579 domain-containing protein [Novosphingobium sp.]
MSRRRNVIMLTAVVGLVMAKPAVAQSAPPPQPTPSLTIFDWLNGAWRGTATVETPNGTHTLTQTERFGPMLGGAVRLIEGKGYGPNGEVQFNAMAVLYGLPDGSYAMHSWAQGRQGIYPVKPQADGFDWEIPAGPMSIRYEARRREGKWVETGYRIMPGKPPVPFYRMELTRIGEVDWAAGQPAAR